MAAIVTAGTAIAPSVCAQEISPSETPKVVNYSGNVNATIASLTSVPKVG